MSPRRSINALLLAYYFPPMGGMGSLRALGLARHLPEAGVGVTVVAPRTGTWAGDPSLRAPEGVRLVRTGTLEPAVLLGRSGRADPRRAGTGAAPGAGAGGGRLAGLAGRVLHLPDSNVGWAPFAIRAALAESRRARPDVILSSSPPLSAHLAAAFVAARLRVPHVADFRDFFLTSRLYGGLRARIDERIEGRVLRGLAGMTAATEGVLASIRERSAAPALLLRNGFDEEDFAGPAPEIPAGLALVHVGSTYADRIRPDAFLAAAAGFAADGGDLRLRFVGAPDAALAAAVRDAGLEGRTELAPFTTHADAIREMRSAPALLLFVWGGPDVVARGIFAGKTFEVLRSGRPVLMVGPEEGETARFLRETGGAIRCGARDTAAIRAALAALAAGRAPAPIPPTRLAPFTRRAQARRLAEWLREVAPAGRRR